MGLDFAVGNGEALFRRLCFLAETLLFLARGRLGNGCCGAAGLLALVEVSFACEVVSERSCVEVGR